MRPTAHSHKRTRLLTTPERTSVCLGRQAMVAAQLPAVVEGLVAASDCRVEPDAETRRNACEGLGRLATTIQATPPPLPPTCRSRAHFQSPVRPCLGAASHTRRGAGESVDEAARPVAAPPLHLRGPRQGLARHHSEQASTRTHWTYAQHTATNRRLHIFSEFTPASWPSPCVAERSAHARRSDEGYPEGIVFCVANLVMTQHFRLRRTSLFSKRLPALCCAPRCRTAPLGHIHAMHM